MKTHTKHIRRISHSYGVRCIAITGVWLIFMIMSPLADATGAANGMATLLVNTESFAQIDSGDGTSDRELRFGASNTKLMYSVTNVRFELSATLYVTGDVRTTETLSGAHLRITKNASVSGNISGSGNLMLEAGNTLSGSIVRGFGLATDCDTVATHKIMWDATTGRFSCGTDQTGGAAGLVDHYVNAGGDTMTGALTVQNGTVHTPTTAALVNARGTLSGAALRVSGPAEIHGTLAASGSVRADGNLTLNDNLTAADVTLTFGNSVTSGVLTYGNVFREFSFSGGIRVSGNISGSGNLMLENGGTLSGSSLFGFGLATDCDTVGSHKIMWDATTGRFSCGTDQTGGASGGGGGWADDGSTVRLETIGDTVGIGTATTKTGVKAEIVGALSGSIIHASSRLASSGVLVLRPPNNAQPTLYANGSQKVGVNTNSPHSSFTSSGTFATTVRVATATGSINGGDQIIFASGSSMITLTLPTAVGINGRQYTIKKTSATLNNQIRPVIINTTGNQTIDRLPSWRLVNRGQQVTVVSDGANWQVMESSSYGLNGGFVVMGTTMNQWYSAPGDATALTTAVLTTTATIRVIPFIAQKVMTINGMAVSIQTTAASSEVRLGIYRDNGNGYPDTLVVDAGTVATTSTGVRSICPSGCTTTGGGTLPVTIQPGLYWLALNNNGIAITARGFAVANLNPVQGYPSNYTTLRNVGWRIANSYAALPSTFPTAASATTAVPIPAVTVRVQE